MAATLLNHDEITGLVALAYELTTAGDPGSGQQMLAKLSTLYPHNQAIEAGLALSFIVCDAFAAGDKILEPWLNSDEVFDETIGIAALSQALQGNVSEAEALGAKIKDAQNPAQAFITNILAAKR